ncbi:cytochrome P450 6a22 [Stomoxys calcitrans]|uniref:Cytochrome P450 n=1 Tax=Stomoxys calcitrans TaxID=35570 RepID=A0A1I8Q9W2_STOCA|nr:cytochrome P450 6a22 [Stomoxys calcitrans]
MDLFLCSLLTLWLGIVFIALKYWQKLNYWKRQNVPLLSVMSLMWQLRRKPLYQLVDDIYNDMCAKKEPFRVVEMLFFTAVIVQDQEAIKNVFISDFEKFADRGLYINHRDPLLSHMGRMEYRHWKPLRQKSAPAFSASQTKVMYPIVAHVGDRFVQVLHDMIASKVPNCQEVEMHNLCARFAIDAIGSMAFGIECNTLNNNDSEFRKIVLKAVREQFRIPFQLTAKLTKIFQALNLKYHSKESIDFFTNSIKQTMAYREKHNIQRSDFLQILMEMKRESSAESQDDSPTSHNIVGQAFLFFAAGYDSISSAMSQALYEMAKNTHIQAKARAEVLKILKEDEGQLTYEGIQRLKYVKQIVLETLRRYSLLFTLPRCSRYACTLNSSSTSIRLPQNTIVLIPAHAVQNNPEFYPEPERFLPERFENELKNRRPACSFLAFGDGPKKCLAEHFSLTQIVAGLAPLLSNFQFSVCDRTPREMVFDIEMSRLSIGYNVFLRVEKLIK